MKRNTISVTVITLNEENNLSRCLSSVKNTADEIVIVDSGSTDKTLEIAKDFKARIFFRKFVNYSDQKNFATEKVRGDWILSLDADEEVSPELAEEITNAVKRDDINGYSIPRKNILLGNEIKHTRWSPDRHIWLWRKGKGRWKKDVHEEVGVEGRVSDLQNYKIHHSYETVSGFLGMMNSYTELIADEMNKNGIQFSYLKLIFSPIFSFSGRFLYKKGFLDGWRGFMLSYMMAIYRMTTWIKLWEKSKVREK